MLCHLGPTAATANFYFLVRLHKCCFEAQLFQHAVVIIDDCNEIFWSAEDGGMPANPRQRLQLRHCDQFILMKAWARYLRGLISFKQVFNIDSNFGAFDSEANVQIFVGKAEVFETDEASKNFCPVVPWLGIHTYVIGREREIEFLQSGHPSYNSRIARDFMLRKHTEVVIYLRLVNLRSVPAVQRRAFICSEVIYWKTNPVSIDRGVCCSKK